MSMLSFLNAQQVKRSFAKKITTHKALGFVLISCLLVGFPVCLYAQTQPNLLNQMELELSLNYHSIGFSKSEPDWIEGTLDASSAQLGLTLPISSNSALIGQLEVQKQTKRSYSELENTYLVKPFFGIGIRHHFMSSGLWIQASYIATYAPFFSGSSSTGYRGPYDPYSYNYYYIQNYSVTTFNSIPAYQQFWRFSLGYQFRPFKQSGLGFGLGVHSTLGKNVMEFDVVKNGIRAELESYQKRETVFISQNAIGFSFSFFVPLKELKKED
ncbi:hypothetical protein MASR2M44_22890 [Bacteroidota bacterium]